jgi:hypothetical protein
MQARCRVGCLGIVPASIAGSQLGASVSCLTWRIVSSEKRDEYSVIIDSILAKSDLNTVSEKRIRKGLQDVIGYDLTPQKVRITRSYCLRSISSLRDTREGFVADNVFAG